MGYKKDDKCIQKAFEDESLFVLMARDHTAPEVVVEWIKMNLYSQSAAKLHEALDRALKMAGEREGVLNQIQYEKINKHSYVPNDICSACEGTGVRISGGGDNCLACCGTGLKIPKEIDTFDPDALGAGDDYPVLPKP
jgi:hypothetical protein